VDVGGNTGAWALSCTGYDASVHVTIVDLPEQIAAARELLRGSPHRDRIELWPADVLDESQPLPSEADTIWMSQFLDCFAEDQIGKILARVSRALAENGTLFVLELFSDRQRHAAATYSLNATSLYFTCIANGASRMYRSADLIRALGAAGFEIAGQHDDLGLGHTLLHCTKRR
jgi:ubiquinone/menaquinone biosynthesis C-methylase UbiE